MGILNVTPCSFWANSRVETLERAVTAGRQMFDDGAWGSTSAVNPPGPVLCRCRCRCPDIGRPVHVDPHASTDLPYPSAATS
ncbi:hypothetical protein AWC02_10375 [Mycolicibacter engbaekii]|uniref:Pterin-binding domain-containing protein n=1 Tax=Mycolicibacter engbaekii TaxID=188915 RepID=A0A1X1TRB6_9MYCO|nr:hypothetical protein AWC02_10375 [Mycolicibacter engbaekii]